MCRYMHVSAGAHGDQKMAADPLNLELQDVVNHCFGYWESNSGPSEEQCVILSDELSPQLLLLLLTDTKFIDYRAQCDVSTCLYYIIMISKNLA